MTLKYSTVQKFWKFIGINQSTNEFQPGNTPSKETVASSTVVAGVYYLDQLGVNSDTLVLYAGSTPLTITTHYTFDSDTSAVTITSDGATALSGEDLTAEYEYSSFGNDLNYTETTRLLEWAEGRIEEKTNCSFGDQSTGTGYTAIVNELNPGKGSCDNLYQTQLFPLIKLQTTVNGDYTSGGTEIVLSDASGFPSTGTIYIGGNKVVYSALSSNTLTVPSSTPSIADGAVVRGEVVEVSTSPSGVDPSFTVLEPDTDYTVDYDTGRIQLMDDYYFQTDTYLSKPGDGLQDRIRFNYQHAWHELGQDASIPTDIEEVVYMIAGRNVVQRTILKSNAGQRDNFTAQSYGFSKVDIDEQLSDYIIIRNSNV